MTIPADLTYIFLDDLHLNEKYQFILLSTNHKDRVVLDIVNFTLTGRGKSLNYIRLIEPSHEKTNNLGFLLGPP